MSLNLNVSGDCIQTTIVRTREEASEGIRALMSNTNNYKRLIGLDTIQLQRPGGNMGAPSLALILQLYDGDKCLIFRLSSVYDIPESLYNFLSLPSFTFAGFGVKGALARLEEKYNLVCNNFLEVKPSKWYKIKNMYNASCMASEFRSMHIPSGEIDSAFLDTGRDLSEDLIDLAVSNVVAAFNIGVMLLNKY